MKMIKINLIMVLVVLLLAVYSVSKALFNWFSKLLLVFTLGCLNLMCSGDKFITIDEFFFEFDEK